MGKRARTLASTLACMTLLVCVVVFLATLLGCGQNRFVGTWFSTGYFSTTDNGVHEVVTTLVVDDGDTWRLSDPIIHPDGTTTPHHWMGTYGVRGDQLRLYTGGSLFATGVQRDGWLTLNSLRFTRRPPAPGSSTSPLVAVTPQMLTAAQAAAVPGWFWMVVGGGRVVGLLQQQYN
jgi:hypothetical protein